MRAPSLSTAGAAIAALTPCGAATGPLVGWPRAPQRAPSRLLRARGGAAVQAESSASQRKTALMQELRKKRTTLEEAAKGVAELQQDSVFRTVRDYTSLIKACSKGDKWQLAVEMLGVMREKGLEPSDATIAVVSEVCERAGHPTLSPAVAAEPEATSNNTKYSRGALMQRLRRRTAQPAELAETVATLVKEGHLDEVKGYTISLRMCESGEQWEWAVQLLAMCREGPGLDVETYNVGIGACAKSQQWQRALVILDDMDRDKVSPDVATYHNAASACSRGGEWEAALAALERAQSRSVADPESYAIGMMACASTEAWPMALSMLAAIEHSTIPKHSKDLMSYGVAVYGCERGGVWPWCLRLLREMKEARVQPDAVTCACTVNACKQGNGWEAAANVLSELRASRVHESPDRVLEEASWVLEGPEMAQPVPLSALATMAQKEVNVYKYVAQRATQGDIDSVLNAIEEFAARRLWLKIQGQQKRELLERSIRKGDRIVEFGCYVGYSSLVMAKQLRKLGGGGSVTTIEVDAATAYVARAVISFAGAEGEVQVRVGCASDWVATGQLGTIDFLLLDHRGTIYHEDLHATEPILSPHARVFADNVLYPGAPLFLNYIDVQGYEIEIHELKEFMRPDLDDWVVICRPQRPHGEMPRATPPELRRLSAEVDAISWRSQQGPVDWMSFQDRLKPVFYAWKEERGL